MWWGPRRSGGLSVSTVCMWEIYNVLTYCPQMQQCVYVVIDHTQIAWHDVVDIRIKVLNKCLLSVNSPSSPIPCPHHQWYIPLSHIVATRLIGMYINLLSIQDITNWSMTIILTMIPTLPPPSQHHHYHHHHKSNTIITILPLPLPPQSQQHLIPPQSQHHHHSSQHHHSHHHDLTTTTTISPPPLQSHHYHHNLTTTTTILPQSYNHCD